MYWSCIPSSAGPAGGYGFLADLVAVDEPEVFANFGKKKLASDVGVAVVNVAN